MIESRVLILLLTEDSGADAHDTHEALLRALLRDLGPGHDPRRIHVEPADAAQKSAMRGNAWDSTRKEDHPRRVALVRSIATRICQSSQSFVVFHYDGDRAWADEANCPRRAVFGRLIRTAVSQLIPTRYDSTARARAMSRLIELVPFYSVEAWLYQNTHTATRICRTTCGGRDVERFEAWAKDRAILDEVSKPKEETVLGDKHNRELATDGFPTKAVLAVGKSFSAARQSLVACDDLAGVMLAFSTV